MASEHEPGPAQQPTPASPSDPAPAGERTPASPAGGAVGPPDDPEEDDEDLTPRRPRGVRLVVRVLAALAALGLVLPAGMRLYEEVRFQRSGEAVVRTLEGTRTGAAVAETVLQVNAVGCEGTGRAAGTAFAVASDDGGAVLVTNRHVVEGARTVGVRTMDGTSSVEIAAVELSEVADVAVLEVAEASELPTPLPLETDPVAEETPVRLIGYPSSMPFTTSGDVLAASRERLLLDLEVDPGASGSPVVTEDGAVVAQVFAVTDDGVGVATPSALVRRAMEDTTPLPAC